MMWRRCGRAEAPSEYHGEQSGMFFQEWWSDRAGRPDNQGNGEDAQEESWMVKLDPENVLWTWLVESVGWLVKRAEVGRDGQTPYERLKGKRARFAGSGVLGEAVMWKRRSQGGPLGKLSCFWRRRHLLRREGQHG